MIKTIWCHFKWHIWSHWPGKCEFRHESCDPTRPESQDILNNTFLRKFEIQDGCHAIFCKSGSYQKLTGHGISNARKKLMLLSRTSTSILNLVLSCPTAIGGFRGPKGAWPPKMPKSPFLLSICSALFCAVKLIKSIPTICIFGSFMPPKPHCNKLQQQRQSETANLH